MHERLETSIGDQSPHHFSVASIGNGAGYPQGRTMTRGVQESDGLHQPQHVFPSIDDAGREYHVGLWLPPHVKEFLANWIVDVVDNWTTDRRDALTHVWADGNDVVLPAPRTLFDAF